MLATTEPPTRPKKARQKDATPARKAVEKVKTTIVLDRQMDVRLSVLAAVRGVDRSTLVAELLAPHLRGVVVSLRGQSGETGDGCDTLPIGEEVAA